MAEITLTGIAPFPQANGYSTTGTTLRVWYNRNFQADDATDVQGGSGNNGFYKSIPCTITSGNVTCPSFTLQTTIDANDPAPQSIQCFARFYSNNTPKDWLFSGAGTPTGWIIYNPDPATSLTFAQLQILNQAPYLANPPQTFLTTAQILALLEQTAGDFDFMTTARAGIGYVDYDPLNPIRPTLVGLNSPNRLAGPVLGAIPTSVYVFDADTYSIFNLTLFSVNVTSSSITYTGLAGKVIVINVNQDGTGGRSFSWPTNVVSPPEVDTNPNAATSYAVFFDGSMWVPFTSFPAEVPSDTSIINPKDQPYGAIADGTTHPLSERFASLAAAQAVFPFATSLSQEIDYCAVQQASNVAFGPPLAISPAGYVTPNTDSTVSVIHDSTSTYTTNELTGLTLFMRYPNGFVDTQVIASNNGTAKTITLTHPLTYDFHPCPGEVCTAACGQPAQVFPCSQYAVGTGEHGFTNAALNKPLFFPGGTYVFGADTWLIRNLVGAHIYGVGRHSTVLTGSSWVFQTDGLWYSKIENMQFTTTSATLGHGAVDIDGEVPGHPYSTRTVQQNTFSECGFDGGGSTYAFALNRQGGSSSQGENLYVNCTWSNATVTYYQNGFNALNNLILRGDMQNYTTGIYLNAGSIRILGPSMESTKGYGQISDTSFVAQGGFDIDCSASGVLEPIIVEGVRSESLRFYRGSSAQTGVLIGNQTTCGTCTAWSALSNYSLNNILVKTSVSAGQKIYRVTTAGVSGAVEPTWPNSGTIADGSVVWTELEYYVVDCSTSGNVTFVDPNVFQTGNYRFNTYAETRLSPQTTNQALSAKQYSAPAYVYFMDTTAGNLTFNLGENTDTPDGQLVTIKKVTTDANTVTISSTGGNGVEGGSTIVIPGGSFGFATFQYAKGNSVSNTWWLVAKSFGTFGDITARTITDSALTSGRVVIAGASGVLADDADLTFATDTLTATKFAGALNGTVGATTPAAGTFTTLIGTSLSITGTPISSSSTGLLGAFSSRDINITASAVGTSSTTYITSGTSTTQATEANRQQAMPACVVRNLRVNLVTTSPAAGTAVITIRKNGADTGVTVSISAGTTAQVLTDLTHSVTFASNDLLSISLVNNDASNAWTITGMSISFETVRQ